MPYPLRQVTLAASLVSTMMSLTACEEYRVAPLEPETEAVLHGRSLAALVADAAVLNHPILKPLVIDFGRPLTLDELAILAVVSNPDLRAARAKDGVASAQLLAAGLLPDPVLSFSYDRRMTGPDPFDAMAGQLSYELAALRDRETVTAGASARRDQVHLDIAWQEWQTAGQAKLLAARIVGLTLTAQVLRDMRNASDQMLALTLKAASQGNVKADDLEVRRLAAATMVEKLLQAERDLAAGRLDLNKLLGLNPPMELSLASNDVPIPTLDAETLFERAKAERLDLRALQAGYASQEAAVRKAILDQFPSLQLTINRAADTAHNQTFGPAINFTLPIWNRNRGEIALAEATRDQLRIEYAARVFATRADIAALTRAITLTVKARRDIADQIPAIEPLVLATEAAARRGDVTLIAADAARQSLRDKQISVFTLDQALAEQTVSLELAVGGPLGPSPP
jgi:cobalt-zinc-cadmium efflux system outer membrane protein